MLQNIEISDQFIKVALPFNYAKSLEEICHFLPELSERGAKVTNLISGLALSHKIYERKAKYLPLQKQWHEKWIAKYPSIEECPLASDAIDKKVKHLYETYSCFETNLTEKSIWLLIDAINSENDKVIDMQTVQAKMFDAFYKQDRTRDDE